MKRLETRRPWSDPRRWGQDGRLNGSTGAHGSRSRRESCTQHDRKASASEPAESLPTVRQRESPGLKVSGEEPCPAVSIFRLEGVASAIESAGARSRRMMTVTEIVLRLDDWFGASDRWAV